MKLLTLKRKLIVWYYKDKEPYRSKREMRKFRRYIPLGMIAIGNNVEAMTKSFYNMTKSLRNLGNI
jgi:hypothetical protein